MKPMSPPLRWLKVGWGVGIVLVLGGCSTYGIETQPQEEIVHVYVSAYPEVAWSDIATQLVPHNDLTIGDARKLATQTTQSQIEQVATTLAGALNLNLAQRSQSIDSKTTDGKTTQSTEQTGQTGAVPSSANPTPALQALPVDGDTFLYTATGLYQQAQILDHQIQDGYLPRGYDMHLVTLQVTVQPLRRDARYDVYLNVNLWQTPLDFAGAHPVDGRIHEPALVIYPLIINDAMELTSVGKSAQRTREALLQLSGSLGTAGGAGGASAAQEALKEVYGSEQNSLVTVGRINDNTLRIRLGASNQVTSGSNSSNLALVPKVYNVSLAVMTKIDPPSRQSLIHVVSSLTLRDPITKHDFWWADRKRSSGYLADEVAARMKEYGYALSDPGCAPDGPEGLNCPGAYLRLLSAADAQDLPYLLGHLNSPSPTAGAPGAQGAGSSPLGALCSHNPGNPDCSERRLLRFIAALTDIQSDSDYAEFAFPIRHRRAQLAPPGSVALLSDDGKNTSVILTGAQGLSGDLSASLKVRDAQCGACVSELAPSALVIQGGSEVDLTFPSLSKYGLKLAAGIPQPLSITLDAGRADTPIQAAYAVASEPAGMAPKPPPAPRQRAPR